MTVLYLSGVRNVARTRSAILMKRMDKIYVATHDQVIVTDADMNVRGREKVEARGIHTAPA